MYTGGSRLNKPQSTDSQSGPHPSCWGDSHIARLRPKLLTDSCAETVCWQTVDLQKALHCPSGLGSRLWGCTIVPTMTNEEHHRQSEGLTNFIKSEAGERRREQGQVFTQGQVSHLQEITHLRVQLPPPSSSLNTFSIGLVTARGDNYIANPNGS